MTQKSSDAFRTISEVAEHLDIPPHVLRFWETKFSTLRPLKRSGGRRYYRPDDVALLERIRDLLYKEGFTIKGAQKHLGNRQLGRQNLGVAAGQFPVGDKLSEAMDSLNAARKALESAMSRSHLDNAMQESSEFSLRASPSVDLYLATAKQEKKGVKT